jgi:hypothetical protein
MPMAKREEMEQRKTRVVFNTTPSPLRREGEAAQARLCAKVKAIPPAMGPGYASATKMIAPSRMKTHASEIRGCSLPPSQTASWLRPRSCRRRIDVGERIIIGDSRGELLATDITGKQPLYIGKAGQIA